MDGLRRILPSRGDTWAVFLAIVFLVDFWSLIFFLRELPSYLMRMNLWDIVGVFAYAQVIALFESLILLGLLLVVALLVPVRLFREHFAVAGALTAFTAALWAMTLHFQAKISQLHPVLKHPWAVWVWAAFLLFLLAGALYFIFFSPRLEGRLRNFMDRLSTVSAAYLALNILAVLIVVARNLGLH